MIMVVIRQLPGPYYVYFWGGFIVVLTSIFYHIIPYYVICIIYNTYPLLTLLWNKDTHKKVNTVSHKIK